MPSYETLSLARFTNAQTAQSTDAPINWQLRALEAEAALEQLAPWTASPDDGLPIDGGLGGKLPWLIYGLAVGGIIGVLI